MMCLTTIRFNFSLWATHPAIETNSDRKSTRLNSSHRCISYAVFCLKKKKHITSKNHIDKYHQQLAILNDPAMLDTLLEREYHSTLFYMIKYGSNNSSALYAIFS